MAGLLNIQYITDVSASLPSVELSTIFFIPMLYIYDGSFDMYTSRDVKINAYAHC